MRVTVLDVTACPPPVGFDTARMQLIGVRVEVQGGHPRGVPANFFYGSLLTTDHSRYLAELPGCSPALSHPPLRPGESAQGYLNFPVPLGKSVETLVYAPPLPGRAYGEGAVELALRAEHAPTAAEEEP